MIYDIKAKTEETLVKNTIPGQCYGFYDEMAATATTTHTAVVILRVKHEDPGYDDIRVIDTKEHEHHIFNRYMLLNDIYEFVNLYTGELIAIHGNESLLELTQDTSVTFKVIMK